jgi:TonB family protein
MRERLRNLAKLATGLGSVVVLGSVLIFASSNGNGDSPVERQLTRQPGVAKVTAGTPKVIGALEQAMIEHTIRSHLDGVLSCHEAGLAKAPGLTGRVVIQFTITASGQVAGSVVESSTLGNPSVEKCIATELRTWKFPRPSGAGMVVISSPFLLTIDTN